MKSSRAHKASQPFFEEADRQKHDQGLLSQAEENAPVYAEGIQSIDAFELTTTSDDDPSQTIDQLSALPITMEPAGISDLSDQHSFFGSIEDGSPNYLAGQLQNSSTAQSGISTLLAVEAPQTVSSSYIPSLSENLHPSTNAESSKPGQNQPDHVAELFQNGKKAAPGQLKKRDNDAAKEVMIEPGTSAADVNALIANASPGSTLVLLEGLHRFHESIIIDRDDLTLRGENEETTIIEFDFPTGEETHGIQILGGSKDYRSTSTEDAAAGTHEIKLAQASGLQAGDIIYLQQPNTHEYLAENGWDNVSFEDADERPFREFIAEVVSVDGNTINLASALPYDFEASSTKIYALDARQNVSLSDLTISHDIEQEVTPNDFSNTLPAFLKTASLFISDTFETTLNNITVLDAPSHAVDIQSSLALNADNLYIDGAHNMGTGGNGYGIQLYETFDSTITDAEIYNVRHALLFSSWHAEANNHIEITATNRDINFHGSPDVNNTVIVAESILEYNPDENFGPTRGYWASVNEGGSTHANTDPYAANTVLFAHAEGFDASDIIFGWDEGAYLDGNAGLDTLIGGSGNDIIVGGTSKDVLTGGEGADTFVFEVGDAYDTISDFSGASQGDVIAFANAPDLTAFDDLRIWQNEEDAYVKYGSNSTIILQGYDASQLTSTDFEFDWQADDDLLG